MRFFSTAGNPTPYSFKDAVIQGLAPDKGLYFPESIPRISDDFLEDLSVKSPVEIGFELMHPFVSTDISKDVLLQILEDTLSFEFPLVHLHDQIYTMELFHGPTLAFKDVGARFMSRCMSEFKDTEKVIVLVATSGDTGSAVANGFLNIPGIEVVVLYPAGKVSKLQEKQFATLGENITALKVDGVFDDCQALVKQAFLNSELTKSLTLSSANSINLARWLPQSIYYGILAAQVRRNGDQRKIVVSVPSGNFGNLTAGLMAQKMGIPIERFIAATNANDVVPEFLNTGEYLPRKSVETIANAMDVGDPSNFVRLLSIFGNNIQQVQKAIKGEGYADEQIDACINSVFQKTGYTLDPHGATGYLAIENAGLYSDEMAVIMETAHPSKFKETVEKSIGQKIGVPERLQKFAERELQSIPMENDFDGFKTFLSKKFA